ncbi:hypothetical protein EHP00_1737 [Ecytonucleospora hepatopenaei]|uniref:Uncharacterized protein n=1 Tax=Ecytonucleospora hepatopenaei TaxID=646526 RepID=A0A1W0E3Y6_9MICR|nr:hypothetical protein EHP00_1737 [Ecytonucleospora hepatopenaei]
MLTNLLSITGVFGAGFIPKNGNDLAIGMLNKGIFSYLKVFGNISAGSEMYKKMKQIVTSTCTDSCITLGPEYSCFCNLGIRIYPLVNIKDTKGREIKLLNFYFDQMRSLVPAYIFNEYNSAYKAGKYDTCYSLLGLVYENRRTCVENTYIKALNKKSEEEKNGKSGILFVDTVNGKMYLLECRSMGTDPNILILPNNSMCLETFLSFSLYLIDRIVQTSENSAMIMEVKRLLFEKYSVDVIGSDITICLATAPVTQLVVYKFYVYCMLTFEIFGVSSQDISTFSEEFKKNIFKSASVDAIVVKDECYITKYISCILFGNNENVQQN